MTRPNWFIKTHTKKHYVSTAWLEPLGFYETMIFEKLNSEKDRVDWGGKHTIRTEDQERAVLNHCDAIWHVHEWER